MFWMLIIIAGLLVARMVQSASQHQAQINGLEVQTRLVLAQLKKIELAQNHGEGGPVWPELVDDGE